jgi:hypothetical protein
MLVGWVEFNPESGLITQVRGMSYRDHEETRTHVRRRYMERFV